MSDSRRMNLFVYECFQGDRVKCSEITSIAESSISRIVSGRNKMGRGVMDKIVAYCREENLDYHKYIQL